VVRPSSSTAVVSRSGTADDGRRQMAETGAWGRFVDMQMLRTIIGSAAGVILTLSSVVAVSHRLLESDLTSKLNTSRPSSML
jgi:hypothetical protein